MKKWIILACLCFAFSVSNAAFAGAQQEKMKGCSAEAKGMTGDERKAFMSKCLKKDYMLKHDAASAAADKKSAMAEANAGDAAPAKQQNKMKTCNADAKAKDLKGDERKKFMSACLKN